MRIGVASDLHLGYERFYEDSITHATKAFDFFISQRVDAVLIAGDVFDESVPTPEVLAVAFDLFSRLRTAKIPVYAIAGNHERRAKEQVNPIQLLERVGLLTNIHGRGVVIGTPPAVYVYGMHAVPEEFASLAIEKLRPQPHPELFSIFMFHQTLSELAPLEHALSVSDLPPHFDLYIDGHLHARSFDTIAEKRLLIPGSTVLTQLRKEESEEKGVYLLTITDRATPPVITFQSIETRPFVYKELVVDHASPSEVSMNVKELIDDVRRTSPHAIVRIVVRGTLASGYRPRDVVIKGIDRHAIHVDFQFDADETLHEKVKTLRNLREGKLSVKEQGLRVLGELLKGSVPRYEEYFALLEENPDALMRIFTEETS